MSIESVGTYKGATVYQKDDVLFIPLEFAKCTRSFVVERTSEGDGGESFKIKKYSTQEVGKEVQRINEVFGVFDATASLPKTISTTSKGYDIHFFTRKPSDKYILHLSMQKDLLERINEFREVLYSRSLEECQREFTRLFG